MREVLRKLIPTFVASVLMMSTMSLPETVSAQAGQPAVQTSTPQRLYIAGEDSTVEVDATLPATCSPGARVTVGLFDVTGEPAINRADPLFEGSVVVVGAGGKVHGSVRIPNALPRSMRSLWPGVAADCLQTPLVSSNPNPLVFGVRDLAENPGGSSTFVIPRESLFRGRPTQVVHTTMTAYANGQKCETVDFDNQEAKDAEGNVRLHLGSAGQPKECSTPGATVTFYNSLNMPLVETRTVTPGVSQPVANLAPKVGPGSSDLTAPATGGSRLSKRDDNSLALGFILAGAGLGGVLLVAIAAKRRGEQR